MSESRAHGTIVHAFATKGKQGGNPCPIVIVKDENPPLLASLARKNAAFSETAFVIAPKVSDDAFQVRYYTPITQIPFAGHPTIATAHYLKREGFTAGHKKVVFHLQHLSLPISYHEGGNVSFQIAKPRVADFSQTMEIKGLFNIPVRAVLVDAGTPFLLVSLAKPVLDKLELIEENYESVYSKVLSQHRIFGIHVFSVAEAGSQRLSFAKHFSPPGEPWRDPFTGSATAAMALLIEKEHGWAEWIAMQGEDIGVPCQGHVQLTDDHIILSGDAY